MSQSKAQLVSPLGNVDVSGGIIVSGATTAGTFGGNFTGTATGLSGTPNLNVGVITATTFVGDGSNLTGIAATPFVGQNVTSVAGVTTINLSNGSIIYFTHNTDTTVAFANTSTTQSLTFIRTKDDTTTARSLTWPTSVVWSGGVTPTLINNPRSTDAQQFNLLTRDGGLTWYGHQEVNINPQPNLLFAWGYNLSGQLGLNNRNDLSSPIQIPGNTWSSISGGSHSLSIKTDNTLWSWGSNSQGQLGQNNTTYRSSPVQIPGTTWRSVSASSSHSLTTKTDGTLWAYGNNYYGQLGQSNTTRYSSPVQIPGNTWSSITSGAYYSLATKTDNTLWMWGLNNNGQLGQNNTTSYSSPIQIPGNTWTSNIAICRVTGQRVTSLATKSDGTLWAWGFGEFGELGINISGNSTTAMRSSPVQIPGNTWSSVTGGSTHVLATKTDGTLWAWGSNSGGELGQGNKTYRSSPVQIPGTTWSSISGGNGLSFATKTDGTLWSWGNNYGGQLGQNNTFYYSSPVQIPGTSWYTVSSGSNFGLGLQYTP